MTTKTTRRGRYEIGASWTEVDRQAVDHFWEEVGTQTTEVADLVDTRTGDRYKAGARRVTVKIGKAKRTKTFIGEMARAEARNWADETLTAMLRTYEVTE